MSCAKFLLQKKLNEIAVKYLKALKVQRLLTPHLYFQHRRQTVGVGRNLNEGYAGSNNVS
jgi:hypothetical protein